MDGDAKKSSKLSAMPMDRKLILGVTKVLFICALPVSNRNYKIVARALHSRVKKVKSKPVPPPAIVLP